MTTGRINQVTLVKKRKERKEKRKRRDLPESSSLFVCASLCPPLLFFVTKQLSELTFRLFGSGSVNGMNVLIQRDVFFDPIHVCNNRHP